MMKSQLFAGLLMALCVFDLAWTYPLGAPDAACMNMMPMHYENKSSTNPLNQPQVGMPYFSIHVDRSMDLRPGETTSASTSTEAWDLRPGEMVEVTIKADQYYFEGFLIQAHMNDMYGTLKKLDGFTTFMPDTQLACGGKAVTHSEHKKYDSTKMYWTVPAMQEDSCMHFVATVVKGYSTFFMGVNSEMVCFDGVDQGSMDAAPADVRPLAAGLLLLVAMTTALFARH
ncbi:hypothetical protein EGW08_019593 [Elysia chlorotica]|uniref:Reelin domain-containing protein n=1 Tax=Elysia chlorotica TaxID=188477 RepID=A0A3S1BQU1_ELYCH|nr:hypothetical protein EGW08_019593 [Elysia chlorotica]